jgi:hypothetical protein
VSTKRAPWIVGYEDDSDFCLVGPDAGGGLVTNPIVRLHCEEDARLIAAAPDLRAVAIELDLFMLVIESAVRHSDPKNHAAVMALILANRAALAKATNGEPNA